MRVENIDLELTVDWVLRDLSAAALRGVARTAEAEQIQCRPPITMRTLRSANGLARYQHRLERITAELTAIVEVLEPTGRPDWEQEARAYAEIGSACMDLAYQVEHLLLSTGEQAGRWAVRLVHTAHRLDAYLRPGAVAAAAQRSYHALFDTVLLEGRGRLLSGSVADG
ncbi:hypothetical protein [Nocardia sp. IFM 10818]